MRIRRLFEAPVSLLTELRLLMWVEFLLRGLIWMYSHPLTCKHDESAYISISAVNSNMFSHVLAHIGLTLRKNYAKLFLAVKLDFYIQTGGEYHEKSSEIWGSSLASAEQFQKVGNIIHADKDRRYVVPSAPGKRFSEDIKVTDMLYDCYRAAESGKDFSKNYRKYRRVTRRSSAD